MTLSKKLQSMMVSRKFQFALCALAIGVGAQLASPPSQAANLTCVRACNIAKQACIRAGGDVAECYSAWSDCLAECGQ